MNHGKYTSPLPAPVDANDDDDTEDDDLDSCCGGHEHDGHMDDVDTVDDDTDDECTNAMDDGTGRECACPLRGLLAEDRNVPKT